MSNVLITFHSTCGETEKLAAAAAVGAVQARALIRLRRVPDSDAAAGDCQEALSRMQREYVAPARADVEWADALIFALPPSASGDWSGYRELLGGLSNGGKLEGKAAVLIGAGATGVLSAPIRALRLNVLQTEPKGGALSAHDAMVQGRRASLAGQAPDARGPASHEVERLLPEAHDLE